MNTCKIANCEEHIFSMWYCKSHYEKHEKETEIPLRLEIDCPCGAHWIQDASKPVDPCAVCGRTPDDFKVEACDGSDGSLTPRARRLWVPKGSVCSEHDRILQTAYYEQGIAEGIKRGIDAWLAVSKPVLMRAVDRASKNEEFEEMRALLRITYQ